MDGVEVAQMKMVTMVHNFYNHTFLFIDADGSLEPGNNGYGDGSKGNSKNGKKYDKKGRLISGSNGPNGRREQSMNVFDGKLTY